MEGVEKQLAGVMVTDAGSFSFLVSAGLCSNEEGVSFQ